MYKKALSPANVGTGFLVCLIFIGLGNQLALNDERLLNQLAPMPMLWKAIHARSALHEKCLNAIVMPQSNPGYRDLPT